MKFSVEDIKNLTFPSGAMGYRKKDVDDFLSYVARDYKSYQQQVQNFKAEAEEVTAEKEKLEKDSEQQRRQDLQKMDELIRENKELKRKLNEFRVSSQTSEIIEVHELTLSQKVALKIEKQAQEEARKIREEADAYRDERLAEIQEIQNQLDWKLRSGLTELVKNEREILTSVDHLKEEYLIIANHLRKNFEAMMENPKEYQRSSIKEGEANVF